MAYAAPNFAFAIRFWIELILLVFALVIEAVALVHAITQRSDGFSAIGTLPKGGWIAILAICLLFTLPILGFGGALGIFGLVGIAAGLIYLLDVRPGLRDLRDGRGSW